MGIHQLRVVIYILIYKTKNLNKWWDDNTMTIIK